MAKQYSIPDRIRNPETFGCGHMFNSSFCPYKALGLIKKTFSYSDKTNFYSERLQELGLPASGLGTQVHLTIWSTVFIWLYDGVFPFLEWLQKTKSVLWNFTIIPVLPFLNNPKDLDLSYKKTDLDFWDCFGGNKALSYNLWIRVFLMNGIDQYGYWYVEKNSYLNKRTAED